MLSLIVLKNSLKSPAKSFHYDPSNAFLEIVICNNAGKFAFNQAGDDIIKWAMHSLYFLIFPYAQLLSHLIPKILSPIREGDSICSVCVQHLVL